ncbi:A disintegrin and metalloproteinase with thrombospondin motifs 20-like [Ruditapes philippinarum]|uniref:A disintegrin and metalloproteinase with thrombospondin motifs 20-like n=1 Tax=Ruditapes philippinarum TaxID=129788 RepID=UPI00295BA7A1|nr:A disintegrin and metalloproteinase with thrombospondin motifs 20-like [Ruditapes philippinarum]
MRKSGSALFNLYGIQLRYLNDRQNGETLEIVGKIEKSIVVQILRFYDYHQYAGVTPNMSYTYNIPSPHSSQSYAWAELPNQSCSRSCGSGVKSKTIKCMSIRGEFVDDYHCSLENKPKQTFSKCNTQACPPTWKVSDWGQCSVECGTGIKSRILHCVSMVNGVDQAIPSSKCDDKLKPHNTSSCENLCTWKPGIWSKCTRTCGEGYRTRELVCVQSTGADVEINATLCDQDSKPVDTIRCRNDPCFVLPGTCVDKRPDCKKYYDYESTACDGKYRNWMFTNCLKTCGVCRNGSCVDENSCQRVDQSVDACNNPSYKVWMHAHCPQSCNLCRDCADCSKYDPKYCTDSQYRGFMAKNCRKYCKLC